RCRHERRSRSCTRCEAAPQAGQLSSAPWQLTSKSMRLRATSNLTSSTAHGGCNPSALVNSASTPTPLETLPAAAAPWTCAQPQMQPAHMPTGLDYDDQQFSLLDSTRNDEGPQEPPGRAHLRSASGRTLARAPVGKPGRESYTFRKD